MFRYTITIFLSAFLLFQVQPIIGRCVLPWFGGSAMVWNTCMLFFQIVLLLGYCYSHLTITYLKPKQQWYLHVGLLGLAAVLLGVQMGVQPADFWKPAGDENITSAILLLLAATIGLPFFMLSTTGPLIQAWQSRTHASFPTYLLFALSNTGSLLALFSYPFLIEPYLRMGTQSIVWSIGFVVFALFCFYSGWQLVRQPAGDQALEEVTVPDAGGEKSKVAISGRRPGLFICLIWILLAAAPSSMLLATTNQMCQEVASVPFLWILPLSLYLITFIVCFAVPYGYLRIVFLPLVLGSIFLAVYLLQVGVSVPLPMQVAGYALILFACCMCCHGELSDIKPPTKHLTLFYLMVSIGGALGGVFVVIVAPLIFKGYYEFHWSLAVCAVLSTCVYLMGMIGNRGRDSTKAAAGKSEKVHRSFVQKARPFLFVLSWLSVPILMFGCSFIYFTYEEDFEVDENESIVFQDRNSYGTVKVTEYAPNGKEHSRELFNGRIKHGTQYSDSYWSTQPISYYSAGSGVGVAVTHLRTLATGPDDHLKIGVIGLGTGTVAAWGQEGDEVVFYEINPMVVDVAEKYFTYLSHSQANVEIVLGDARIQLEREMKETGSRKYDVLVVDAFSSDAIPIHLLTRECFKIYTSHLSERGVLAIHISNRYLNLEPICYNLAKEAGYLSMLVSNDDDDANMIDGSNWVLVTKNTGVAGLVDRNGQAESWADIQKNWEPGMADAIWTDDFASLSKILDWETDDFIKEQTENIRERFKKDKPKDADNADDGTEGDGTEANGTEGNGAENSENSADQSN